jgi:O-antigen/teichoic acid export membrane protein
LALANVFIVARALGPTGRGEVAFLMAISAVLTRLGAFGIHEANINYASADPQLRPSLATNSIFLAAVTGSTVACGAVAVATVAPIFGNESDYFLIALALASIPLALLKTYLWRFIQADYRFGIASVSWTLPFIVNLVVNVLLLLLGALTVATAFSAWVAAQAVPVMFLIWHVTRRLDGFGRPDFALARKTLRFGIQTHLYQIMSMGNVRLDQWILGVIGSTRELGLYSVAVSVSTAIYQLPSALDLAQRPDLARGSKSEAARRASTAFRVAVTTTVSMAVVLAILAPFLFVLVFGQQFRGSVDDFRVLMLGAVGVIALKLLGNALTAQGRPLLVSVGVAAGFVLTLVLDVSLIPPFGGLGAAIASAVAYTTVGAVVAVMFLRALDGRAADLVPRRNDASLVLAQLRKLLAFRNRRRPTPAETAIEPPAYDV